MKNIKKILMVSALMLLFVFASGIFAGTSILTANASAENSCNLSESKCDGYDETHQYVRVYNNDKSSEKHYVEKVRYSGLPDKDSIVVVFMGDGYTSSQQDTFVNNVQAVTNTMLDTHPFSLFKSLFTVYAVKVISSQSGVTHSSGTTFNENISVNTYFAANYYKNKKNEILIDMPEANQNKAKEIAYKVSGHVAMMQVLANGQLHGGVTFWDSYTADLSVKLALTATESTSNSSWSTAWHGTVIHEFGHAFGQLIDEHSDPVGFDTKRANATKSFLNIDGTDKWNQWFGHRNVRTYPKDVGVYDSSPSLPGTNPPKETRYVPSNFIEPVPNMLTGGDCIMVASWAKNEFCGVCSAELIRRMASISGETFIGRSPSGTTPISNDKSVTIKENENNRILDSAFHGNTVIESVTIPASITKIHDYAFLGATGLKEIINYSATPQPINNTTFADSGKKDGAPKQLDRTKITLFVPLEKTQAYIDAGWTGFNIVEQLSTTVIDNNKIKIDSVNFPIIGLYNIPDKINGKMVTEIGNAAFINQELWTSTILPYNLTSIGNYAFENCFKLVLDTSLFQSSFIPLGVTSIGEGAFKNCSSLTKVFIPAGVKNIRDYTFYGCSSLTEYSILGGILNNSLKNIGNFAFENCLKLTNVDIPFHTESIGESAFSGCNSLLKIDLYSGSIGDFAFSKCSKLEQINIGAGVTSIGKKAFSDCPLLNSVVYSATNCADLQPDSDVFFGATKTIKVTFGKIVLSEEAIRIPAYLFYNVSLIEVNAATFTTFIVTPPPIHYIGNDAFTGTATWAKAAGKLLYVEDCLVGYNGTISGGLVLNNNIVGIADSAFLNQNGLTSVTIPKWVYIGTDSFKGCSNLTIYTEESARPGNYWYETWNSSNRPVVWGCTLSADKSYVVSFSKSSAGISNSNVANGISAPYRKGYTFGGWYTNSAFSGLSYTVDQIASVPDGVYYAKWILDTFDVNFDLNGGTGSFDTVTVINGDVINQPVAIPENGSNFMFWALSTDLTQEYDWAAPVTVDITLVAVWEKVTVTFDSDSTFGIITLSVNCGSAIGTPPEIIAQFESSLFLYWALPTDLTTAYDFNTPVYNDLTLVAVWFNIKPIWG